jgi:CubicO group peptidase (beta-lactamase class C family)
MSFAHKLYILYTFIFVVSLTSDNLYFPSDEWKIVTPESQNINSAKVQKIIDLSFLDQSTLGVVIIKNGKIIGEKYADGYSDISHGTSWSMAKSYYAALIGISIEKGEIDSLDDNVGKYLDYYNDERSKITIRDLLDMSSGLDFPDHEHEKMFFQTNHLEYAKAVGVEKDAGLKWEYNNVNSMIIGDILFSVTGIKADKLLSERIFEPIGVKDYKLWKDESGNVLTYCCVDMSAQEYSKFGLLFARNGNWNGRQIIPKNFIDETFRVVWGFSPDSPKRGYSLHWWISKYDNDSKIFNTSGKFGQYTFVDRDNDIVFTRITKYTQKDHGDIQKWGPLQYFRWAGVSTAVMTARTLLNLGIIKEGTDVVAPITEKMGESKEFYQKYDEIIDAMADLSKN